MSTGTRTISGGSRRTIRVLPIIHSSRITSNLQPGPPAQLACLSKRKRVHAGQLRPFFRPSCGLLCHILPYSCFLLLPSALYAPIDSSHPGPHHRCTSTGTANSLHAPASGTATAPRTATATATTLASYHCPHCLPAEARAPWCLLLDSASCCFCLDRRLRRVDCRPEQAF